MVNYFFVPPLYSLSPFRADLPRLIAFVVCAIVANAVSTRQKRVENALRLARDGLEQTVKERTVELQSANESLSAEVEERKRAESALRASEDWWRTIFEASNVPMGVTDLSGRHVIVNAASERVLGYSNEELRSMSIAELTHEDDRDSTLPVFDELKSGRRRDYHVTKRYRCKDGGVKWPSATVTRAPDPKGGPRAFRRRFRHNRPRQAVLVGQSRVAKDARIQREELQGLTLAEGRRGCLGQCRRRAGSCHSRESPVSSGHRY
jgi:PAS domain S-box-containing protein